MFAFTLSGVRMPEKKKFVINDIKQFKITHKDLSETFEITGEALATTRGTISVLDNIKRMSPVERERYVLNDLPIEVENLKTKLEVLTTKLEPFTKLPPEKIVEYWATRHLVERIENVETNVNTRLKDFDKRLEDHKAIFNELKGRINWFSILIIIIGVIIGIASNIDKFIKALMV